MFAQQSDAFFGPMEEYTLAPVARYCSAWDSPILTPSGMSTAFQQKHDELEGFTTLTRMLGSYLQLGYALHGIFDQFHWRTAFLLYHNSEQYSSGYSDCTFRMEVLLNFIEHTETQDQEVIVKFDEMLATTADYRHMMERVKRNSRRKSTLLKQFFK